MAERPEFSLEWSLNKIDTLNAGSRIRIISPTILATPLKSIKESLFQSFQNTKY